MELTPVYADDSAARRPGAEGPGQYASMTEQAAAIGLRTEPAREEVASGEVRTLGRVEAQESRRFLVTAGADGWIRRIHGGESGSMVVKGQPLASYYSRDVTSPQQAYLYALDAQQRLPATATAEQKDLAARQVTQARDYLEFLGSDRAADRRSWQVAPGRTRGHSRRAGFGRSSRTECLRGRPL